MNRTREMLVALVIVMGVGIRPVACRGSKGNEADDGGVTTSSAEEAPDVDPTASWGRLDAAPPPQLLWGPVLNLMDVEGSWGSQDDENEGWAELTSKRATLERKEQWRYPYPWHLLLHPPKADFTYDCGVHEGMEDAGGLLGWRVGWCEGGSFEKGRRHAVKIFFHEKETFDYQLILINLHEVTKVELERQLP